MNGLANWLLGFCIGLALAQYIPQPWRVILSVIALLTGIVIIWANVKVTK